MDRSQGQLERQVKVNPEHQQCPPWIIYTRPPKRPPVPNPFEGVIRAIEAFGEAVAGVFGPLANQIALMFDHLVETDEYRQAEALHHDGFGGFL